jgi:cytochrome c-type biogenesis protein CcmH
LVNHCIGSRVFVGGDGIICVFISTPHSMLAFWLLATLMTLVALAIVLVPMLRVRRASDAPTARDANLAVLRGQRREIEADVANGTLPADARDEALAELVRRAEDDLSPATDTRAPISKRPWVAVAVAAVAIPVLAFGLYLAIGTPSATDPAAIARAEPQNDAQMTALVESLAKKVRERPDDARGWELLARSMAALGRFSEAVVAYERLTKLAPGNPDVLADYADALAMAQGRTLKGRPYELVQQALAIDPLHRKSLALAGTAAMDAGDLKSAAKYFEALARELPPESEDGKEVRAILAEIAQRGGPRVAVASAQGPTVSNAPGKSSAPAPTPGPAAPGKTVSGSVAIAPEIAAKVSGSETLFVFARAEGGPRMPLAVLRRSARELPLQFALDDSMAMTPATRLSGASAVRIEARISRSGNAIPQPGDLVGTSDVVAPGARGVKIVVDKVVP